MAIKKTVAVKTVTSKKTAQPKNNSTRPISEMQFYLKSLLKNNNVFKRKATVKKSPANKIVVKKQPIKKAITKNISVKKAFVKKATVNSKAIVIKKSDLKGYTLEQILTKNFGKKGTKSRSDADKRIENISKKRSL